MAIRFRRHQATSNTSKSLHNCSVCDAKALESEINQITGVVCSGLFARRPADVALIASAEGVKRLG